MIQWFQFTKVYIGPIPIQVWGFFVALGIAVALVIIWKRGKRLGMNSEILTDHSLYMIIAGIAVSRLFYALFYAPEFYFKHPIDIFKIWQGGLSSFGGFVGAIIGFFIYAKNKKILNKENLARIADVMSFGALYGWIIGRIGCVMIHDHPGIPCNCFLDIQREEGRFLDMAILEIIFLLPLAASFFILRKRITRNGWHTAMIFLYFGALRFFLDFLRVSDTRYFGLTPSQYFAIIFVLIGVSCFLKRNKNHVFKRKDRIAV